MGSCGKMTDVAVMKKGPVEAFKGWRVTWKNKGTKVIDKTLEPQPCGCRYRDKSKRICNDSESCPSYASLSECLPGLCSAKRCCNQRIQRAATASYSPPFVVKHVSCSSRVAFRWLSDFRCIISCSLGRKALVWWQSGTLSPTNS